MRAQQIGLLGFGLLVGTPALAGPPTQVAPAPAAIVGGEASEPCAWPSVVALRGGGICTGTLIHPRVVAYAAHCGTLQSRIYFGETADAPAREVDTVDCARFSDLFAVSSMDYAYCVLAEPVEDVAITPTLFGCDEDLIEIGTPVTIVGFGDTTSEGPEQVGIKHEAQTEITNKLSTVWIGGMGVGADSGDSGGPAFVQLDDGSWWLLGIVSGGGGDGATVQYVPAPNIVAWIEDETGIDITPCHDQDGAWAPTPQCEGFYVSTQANAQWDAGCPSERSEPSTRCGPAWTELEDLDAPSVAFVDPLDGDQFPTGSLITSVLAEASDAGVGVASVQLRVDGQPWLDELGLDADEVPPYRFNSVMVIGEGPHLLELVAVDHFGNVAEASATILLETSGAGETGETGTDEAGSSDTGQATGSDTSGDQAESGRGSCACTSGAPGSPPLALLVWLGLIGLGRRSRDP